jgi:hypothetical protein
VGLSRRSYLVIFLILLALGAAGGAYYRHLVNRAAADCAMPAPPERPKTPPPNLPGFAMGTACGPNEELQKK